MDNFELFFQFKGAESIIGFSYFLGMIILVGEFMLLITMNELYYTKGPFVTKIKFKYQISKTVAMQRAKMLTDQNIIQSRFTSNYILIKFRSSIIHFLTKGNIYTQRIILYLDEDNNQIYCESRQLISSILLPILVIFNMSFSAIISKYPEELYFSIVKILVGILFGGGLYYYLRGKSDVISNLESKMNNGGQS